MAKIDLNRPIFHLGMDLYQSLPACRLFRHCHIVAYRHNSYAEKLKKKGVAIFTLADKIKTKKFPPRSSGHLLAHPLTQEYIKKNSRGKKAVIAVYKPSLKIEIIAKKNGWQIVGAPSRINKLLENKVNFFQLFSKNKRLVFPKTIIVKPGKAEVKKIIKEIGLPAVVQSPRGWSGRSTKIAKTKEELAKIIAKIHQPLKISRYINGITVTNNAVVYQNGPVVQSHPAYQLTGESSLTSLPASTCGRGWPAIIPPFAEKKIKEMTLEVGRQINLIGFKGFFGLDFLLNPKGEVFLLEINPRLTASFPFYTQLELKAGLNPLLLRHYQTFLNFKINAKKNEEKKRRLIKGSELVQKNLGRDIFLIEKTLPSGQWRRGRMTAQSLEPDEKSFTLIAPEKGESVRFNQEIFKISLEKQVLFSKNNQIRMKKRTKSALRFFQNKIANA